MTFNLDWSNFPENSVNSIKESRADGAFTDVTLVCEDDQVEAHRVILAASSPFFNSILRRIQHPHPLIFLKDVRARDLTALVDFMYNGRTDVLEDDLPLFMSLAESIQLKGISSEIENISLNQNKERAKHKYSKVKIEPITHKETQEIIDTEDKSSIATTIAKTCIEDNTIEDAEAENSSAENVKVHNIIKGTMHMTTEEGDMKKSRVVVDKHEDLDQVIKTLIFSEDGMSNCTMCGKSSKTLHSIITHIEANHIMGLMHTCNFCTKFCRTRDALRKHIIRIHKDFVLV